MSEQKHGQARVTARARLLAQLGEQLITDEVAAVSELVKNAYDADSTKVLVDLVDVSGTVSGYIQIKDNGHGMTLEKVISSWLELGTLSKARDKELKPRVSESGRRTFLGEKGLGRLSVHKLGHVTELVTRRINENTETKLVMDWSMFEQNEGFLQDVPVQWQVTAPRVFTTADFSHGTQLTITNLQRCWTEELIQRVQYGLSALKSPFVRFADFDVVINIDDKLAPRIIRTDIADIVDKATYKLEGNIDTDGFITGKYCFGRPDLAGISRDKPLARKDIRNPNHFQNDRKPRCGPFSVRFYAWDLLPADIKAVFVDTSIYREVIRPNTGVKVFRDQFRVLPYGNTDNDWLSMDLERVRRFELHISRNMTIGAIEITSKTNPNLLDKTDREGLIDNDAFKDFRSLVKTSIALFEAERFIDRRKLKEVTGRIVESPYRATFSATFAALSKLVSQKTALNGETRVQIERLIQEAREAFDKVLIKNEQPLLVAASIGLTYMMPTHEVRRDLHEARRLLRKMGNSSEELGHQLSTVDAVLKQAEEVVNGIAKLMQQTSVDETVNLGKVASLAHELMRYRCDRNSIDFQIVGDKTLTARGSDRLITVSLLNFLDNSIFWLQRNNEKDRKIRIVIAPLNDDCIIAVSDNGPGFEDDLGVMTLPFFTRKPGGMGLGLYIADRIAKMNGGHLKLLIQGEIPELLSGACIGVVLKRNR